jgi:hypothetical protein
MFDDWLWVQEGFFEPPRTPRSFAADAADGRGCWGVGSSPMCRRASLRRRRYNLDMLTYQLHTRLFVLEPGEQLVFPNKVMVKVEFSPGTTFGTQDSRSRVLVKARKAIVTVNANTGRWWTQSTPPLEPLDVTIEMPSSMLQLRGNILTHEFYCESFEMLQGSIMGLKWLMPPLLSLRFPEPPIVDHISGKVGETRFRWEHDPEEWRVEMRTTTHDVLEEHFANSFNRFALFNGTDNRRLAAAVTYFHVAVRLHLCGDSDWEFMAESILNYAKCLDVLFVTSETSKDDIRRELKKLGYSSKEIEGKFIPINILRSYVDVAHPKVTMYKPQDLKVLYRYVDQVEGWMSTLLLKVMEKVSTENYTLPEHGSLVLNGQERKDLNRLIDSMKSCLPTHIPLPN